MSASSLRTWEEAVSWLVSQPDQQALVRDCYYDSPLEAAVERYWKSREWTAVRQLLPRRTAAVLDIGAGHGITSYALARDGWDVTALEPDPSAVVGAGAIRRLASSQNLPITVIQEFGERIPCPSASFDLVFARQALHHAKDLPMLCAEAARLLKQGGTFVAIRDHVISKRKDLPRFFDTHPLHKLYGGENAFLLYEYLDAMRGAGFEIERVIRPLENAVNLAPLDEESLRAELVDRINHYPCGALVYSVLKASDPIYAGFLQLLMVFDSRPGRLYSFVCRKPSV
jgi:SAM-dependent methyltransferase